MKPSVPTTSQYRNRSTGPWVGRNARFTELITFRKAMNPKRTNRADPRPMTLLRRSPLSLRRRRAFSSSTFAISALLFHVPDHEDEPELTHWDHQPHDDVEQRNNEPGACRILANEGHDRHDHDEEQGERDDDRHDRLREHPERLHLLPLLEAVFFLEFLRLHEDVREDNQKVTDEDDDDKERCDRDVEDEPEEACDDIGSLGAVRVILGVQPSERQVLLPTQPLVSLQQLELELRVAFTPRLCEL